MKKFKLLFVSLFTFLFFISCFPQEIIYVAASSSSDGTGSRLNPLSDIPSALSLAKDLRRKNKALPLEIVLLEGEYHLKSTLEISHDLSGLTIRAEEDGTVTIKGSKELDLNWEKHNSNILVASLDPGTIIDQLFANGDRQILARYPNYNEDGGHFQGHAADAISRERIAGWKNPVGAMVHAMHRAEWGDFHYVISGVDKNGDAILEGGHQNNRPAPHHEKYRMVENVFEELDSPGEWYIDKREDKIFYWPSENIDPNNATFEGVGLKSLIEIKGSQKVPVKNVSIENIRFEHTARTVMEDYEPLLRSDWTMYRGAALYIEGAENCKINKCEFTNLGGNVIMLSGYNSEHIISENHIHECGASGISFVGYPSAVRSPSFQYGEFVPLSKMDTIRGPKNDNYPRNCTADNNLIYRTGRVEKQTAAIQIAMAMGIRVSNNSIYDMPRAGINIGDGTWGGHMIEYNDVFDTVLESGDHGSFNSWGRDRFWHPNRKVMNKLTSSNPDMPNWDAIALTTIRNNRFRCDHGWDIDLDDGSSNYHLYNNLCLNGGIKLREGFYRVVENNIMVNNGFHPHVWFNNSEDVFRRNILMTSHKDIRLDGWGKEVDFNLFPDKTSLEKARENYTDKNSSWGDPVFEDPMNLNFSVGSSSPALALGFNNIPMDNFGVKNLNLKKIARLPKVPEYILFSSELGEPKSVFWLGASLQDIRTEEEKSASGLSRVAGVIVLDIEKNSPASRAGLQAGDVIITAENKELDGIVMLLDIYQGVNWTGKISLNITRNQAEKKINLITK